jgi:glutamate synthase (ferredoxin)
VETYFTNTPYSLGGADLSTVEADSRFHHAAAFAVPGTGLPSVGVHKLRTGEGAEEHLY